ncbi:MAG: triose-phosphate isomerase [Lachnospiraceae bacterium]|nr:triose-phosphate isomerase [Lachnospiraceae bacterium]
MRRNIFAGNWKMNLSIKEGIELINQLKTIDTEDEIVVCPPFVMLDRVCKAANGSKVKVGAQNVHFEDKGAFTGEVSADMLVELGIEYVIVGHSERRSYFAETDETVNKKVHKAMSKGLIPIVCVGESLEQREAGNALEVVTIQVKQALKGIDSEKLVIAYEPIWAIGTGRTATPKQAGEVITAIRETLRELFGNKAEDISILYGGSMNGDNVRELMEQKDIDGGLIGSASLTFEKFSKLF